MILIPSTGRPHFPGASGIAGSALLLAGALAAVAAADLGVGPLAAAVDTSGDP